MSQVLPGFELTPLSGTTIQHEPTADAGLPPPLDQITARSQNRSVGTIEAAQDRRGSGSRPRRSRSPRRRVASGDVIVGTFVGLSGLGEPLVQHSGNPAGEPRAARSTVPLDASQIGREVVLSFDRGDPRHPIILGVLIRPCEPRSDANASGAAPAPPIVEVQRDGEQLVLTAEKEIVLRCGEASITLTRAGKVLIRGTYLLSRSSGVNRIKGGSVQIN